MSQWAQASNRLGLGVKQTPAVIQQWPALAAPPGIGIELGIFLCCAFLTALRSRLLLISSPERHQLDPL